MILNEFDAYQAALKKINLDEEVMPIYKGRILTENADTYCKIQKLLACNAFEKAHRWLYDLDVENLDENENSKVCNLYQLGVERGYITNDEDDEDSSDELSSANLSCNSAASVPAISAVVPEPTPAPSVPSSAFVVMYSATRDGQIKTGEAYSNSLNTRSAKADVISKLEKAGYQNITILAIEAGDPDMSGCDNTFCKQADSITQFEDEEEQQELDEVSGQDGITPISHPRTRNRVNRPTLYMVIVDSESILINDYTSHFIMKNLNITRGVKDSDEQNAFKTTNIKDLEIFVKKVIGKYKNSNVIVCHLNWSYAPMRQQNCKRFGVDDIYEPNYGWRNGGELFDSSYNSFDIAEAEQADEHKTLSNEDEEDDKENTSEENTGSEDDGKKDDEKTEDSGDNKDDESNNDDKESKKEEDAEEPDEKLKNDKKEENGKEDATDDKSEKDLSDQEKTQLKDSYKRAFKAAMQKCKYFDKSFDDLTLNEKVKFFETLDEAWKNKADPTKFMSEKETEQLEKIVIKK